MATVSKFPRRPTVADVDALVDEKGSRIEVPPDSELRLADDDEYVVGATSQTNWWLYGVMALVVLAAIVLIVQLV